MLRRYLVQDAVVGKEMRRATNHLEEMCDALGTCRGIGDSNFPRMDGPVKAVAA